MILYLLSRFVFLLYVFDLPWRNPNYLLHKDTRTWISFLALILWINAIYSFPKDGND